MEVFKERRGMNKLGKSCRKKRSEMTSPPVPIHPAFATPECEVMICIKNDIFRNFFLSFKVE